MILRAVFLGRPFEIDSLFGNDTPASKIFPEEHEKFVGHIPEEERGDMAKAYFKRVTSPDENIRNNEAIRYTTWESTLCTLLPEKKEYNLEKDKYVISTALLECHYFLNNIFFKSENHILENIDKVKNIPTIIVQGRYDMCCPPVSAYDLHKAIPGSQLRIVTASHVVWEPAIQEELIKAQEEFKQLFA
ncbi:MAG: hypothetical protein FWG09_07665 [Synergistaceae bacterium]|nr:hypothetical protein [Synergistaceae bacterium]